MFSRNVRAPYVAGVTTPLSPALRGIIVERDRASSQVMPAYPLRTFEVATAWLRSFSLNHLLTGSAQSEAIRSSRLVKLKALRLKRLFFVGGH
jgi:hypothetical protein